MRDQDKLALLVQSLICGFFLSVFAYFLWHEWFLATTASFWIVWCALSVLSAPFLYRLLQDDTKCPLCKKTFSLSGDGQTDIENFVKYKSETIYERNASRTVYVPYNVRRYYQHMRCDSCGYSYQFETKEENKA